MASPLPNFLRCVNTRLHNPGIPRERVQSTPETTEVDCTAENLAVQEPLGGRRWLLAMCVRPRSALARGSHAEMSVVNGLILVLAVFAVRWLYPTRKRALIALADGTLFGLLGAAVTHS